MLSQTLRIARKDCRLALIRGGALIQALLLGLLLVFVFSLAQPPGETVSPRTAAVIFWLASVFCQVLAFTMLYRLEEPNQCRTALLLCPAPVQSVWLGKMLAGLLILGTAQAVFLPALAVFLGQTPGPLGLAGLGILILTDLGMAILGSLLGALSQGQAARESLLSLILFPLLVPILLAGIQGGALALESAPPPFALADLNSWFGLVAAFDAIFLGVGFCLFPYLFSEE